MLQWKIWQSKWLALAWLVFISILFFLPGSALPKEDWFSKVYIDKWVHISFFALLVFLWNSSFIRKESFLILIAALLYGILVEIIQYEWVPNRDFDMMDILADMTGSLIGWFVWLRVYKKNKPL